MTTDPHDEYGEILRRALHAEAARVEPAPDGLERIRAGIEQRSRRRFAGLPDRIPAWLRVPGGWSRPVLAVGVAVTVVAVGVSAPQTIDRITSAGRQGPADGDGRPAGVTNGPGTAGRPGQLPPAALPGQSTAPVPGQSPTSPLPGVPGVPTCTPTGQPSPTQTPSAAPDDAPTPLPPCPAPNDPSSSPKPDDPSSSPEPSDSPPPDTPVSPSPTPGPEQTEGP